MCTLTILPHTLELPTAFSRPNKHINNDLPPLVLLKRTMPALDQDPFRSELLNVLRQRFQLIGGRNVLGRGVAGLLKEERCFRDVGRQEGGLGEEVADEGINCRSWEKCCPRCRDHNLSISTPSNALSEKSTQDKAYRINNDLGNLQLGNHPRHHLNDLLTRQHARLDHIDADVVHHSLDLALHEGGRYDVHALDARGVLLRQGRRGGHGVAVVRGYDFLVRFEAAVFGSSSCQPFFFFLLKHPGSYVWFMVT